MDKTVQLLPRDVHIQLLPIGGTEDDWIERDLIVVAEKAPDVRVEFWKNIKRYIPDIHEFDSVSIKGINSWGSMKLFCFPCWAGSKATRDVYVAARSKAHLAWLLGVSANCAKLRNHLYDLTRHIGSTDYAQKEAVAVAVKHPGRFFAVPSHNVGDKAWPEEIDAKEARN